MLRTVALPLEQILPAGPISRKSTVSVQENLLDLVDWFLV
jgi:hypothetical protein